MSYRIAAIVAASLISSTAFAQAPGASSRKAPAMATPAAKSTKAPVVRTAKSLDCSKQADTKGLHGKPRKSFMSSCKKA